MRVRTGWMLGFSFLLLAAAPAWAKPPSLTHLFPAGAARGQSVTVTAGGSWDHWPPEIWVDGAGLAVEPAPEKGKLLVRVAADAAPGLRWLRLHDEEGATALRPFVVGSLAEYDETEPNNDPSHAQVIALPSATVNGRLAKTGDVDTFSVALRKGQTLVANLEAYRPLGSPMDAVLQVVTPSGFVLAQNDDYAGNDPRIDFTAPSDGSFLVRVFAFPATPDSSIRYAGGEDYVYRLTLTTEGFVDLAFPPAGSRDVLDAVTLVGTNLPEIALSWTAVLDDDGSEGVRLVHPTLAGSAHLRSVAGVVALEVEPNDLAHPQPAPGSGVLCGRIDSPGDRDVYRIALQAGEKRTIRVESRSLGLPLDAAVRVLDAAGKVVAEADDSRNDRDPRLNFTATEAGDYRVVIRDLQGRGGPRFAYILRVRKDDPDFGLTLAADRFDVVPGKPTTLTVNVIRTDNFAGPIEVSAEDLPPGFTVAPVISKPSENSAVALELVADGCAHPGPFRVVGRAVGDTPRSRLARATLGGLNATTDRLWISPVRPAPPKP